MNNILKEFLIIAILVIAFLYILQKSKNEHIDSTLDNITAKTITTSGNIIGGGNISGGGLISEKDAVIKGALTANYIKSNGDIYAGGSLCIGKEAPCIDKGVLQNIINASNKWKFNGETNRNHIETGIQVPGVTSLQSDVYVGANLCLGNPSVCINKDDLKKLNGQFLTNPISNEALQNIGSVYNNNNFTASNINSTGGITATGVASLQSDVYVGQNLCVGNPPVCIDKVALQNLINASNKWKYNGETNRTHIETGIQVPGVTSLGSDVYVGGSLCLGGVCINKGDLNFIISQAGKVR